MTWSLSIPEEIYDHAGADVALPEFYERAVSALAECESIEDANQWKGTADAIIAYSKTVNDDRLEKLAKRIKARAYRRMGELLKQYSGNNNQNTPTTVRLVADQAGLSQRQRETAVRLANVDDFDKRIDADDPPTITELSEAGKQAAKNREYLEKKKPEGFNSMIHLKGDMRRLYEKMNENDPLYILNAMNENDREEMKEYINFIEAWCDTLIINI